MAATARRTRLLLPAARLAAQRAAQPAPLAEMQVRPDSPGPRECLQTNTGQ